MFRDLQDARLALLSLEQHWHPDWQNQLLLNKLQHCLVYSSHLFFPVVVLSFAILLAPRVNRT